MGKLHPCWEGTDFLDIVPNTTRKRNSLCSVYVVVGTTGDLGVLWSMRTNTTTLYRRNERLWILLSMGSPEGSPLRCKVLWNPTFWAQHSIASLRSEQLWLSERTAHSHSLWKQEGLGTGGPQDKKTCVCVCTHARTCELVFYSVIICSC